MQAILYLPYYDYNDEAFDVGNDYYKNNSDYVNAMQQNFQATNNAVANKMANYINGQSVSDYQSIDGQTYRFAKQAKTAKKKRPIPNVSALCMARMAKIRQLMTLFQNAYQTTFNCMS